MLSSFESCYVSGTVHFIFLVEVKYVDYGNTECVPHHSLQPLHSRFCHLPCQAIFSGLNSISPTYTVHKSSYDSMWSDHICEWFSSLLLGKSIEILVIKSESQDHVFLEIFLPLNQLMHSILSNFDCFNSSSLLIPLSSFMYSTGLSCINGQGKRNLHVRDLPPLVVKLNSSQDFTCLISHVADKMHFYVHPVQADLAFCMTVIAETLQNHYSVKENCVEILSEDMKYGSLCAVYSKVFNQWCRGVITCTKNVGTSGRTVKCLVFFLDYGGLEWIELFNVFVLVESLVVYPAQVICCCFEEVAAGIEGNDELYLTNPDVGKTDEDCYSCRIVKQECIDAGIKFLRALSNEDQLIVLVKGEGKYMDVQLRMAKV